MTPSEIARKFVRMSGHASYADYDKQILDLADAYDALEDSMTTATTGDFLSELSVVLDKGDALIALFQARNYNLASASDRKIMAKIANEAFAVERLSAPQADAGVDRALREAFPHFQNGEPVTPDAIKEIGKEYANMVVNWEPQKSEIEFIDGGDQKGKLVLEDFGWFLEDGMLATAPTPEPGRKP